MSEKNFSEFNVRPNCVVVHNPCEFEMGKFFGNIEYTQNLNEKYLFREIPNQNEFSQEHEKYVENLKTKNLNVVKISEILDDDELELYREYMENNPNQVYTRDALITIPWVKGGYILGNMKPKIRRTESIVMEAVAKKLGLKEIVKVPSYMYIEGGDVIPFMYDNKKVLLIGYERRTSKETLFFLSDTLINQGILDEIIGFNLAEWRINLDGGFVPVSDKLVITHPDSILGGLLISKNETIEINPIEYFKKLGYSMIETSREESRFKQTCNCFCVGDNTVFTYNITNKINDMLVKNGINAIGNDGINLVKGTGGPRCMTRPIY